MELIVNRARVETSRSLDNDIYYTMFGVNLEQQIFSRLSVMAMIGDMKFSDSNSRPFLRAKIIVDVLPDHGISFQLRYKNIIQLILTWKEITLILKIIEKRWQFWDTESE